MVAKKANTKRAGKGKKGGGKRSRIFKQAYEKLPKYKFWDEVVIRLTAGEACYSIARWWKSKGEFKDIGVKTLSKYLGQYRTNTLPDEDKLDGATPPATHYINSLVKKYADDIEVFKEFAVLINLQKTRLGVAIEKEETIKFPMEMTNKIAEQLHNLLKDLFEFQVKTGRLPHVPKKFDHRFSGSGGGNGGGGGSEENGSIEVKNRKEELQRKRRVAELALTLINLSVEKGKDKKALPAPVVEEGNNSGDDNA
jgi:hypothetical protein